MHIHTRIRICTKANVDGRINVHVETDIVFTHSHMLACLSDNEIIWSIIHMVYTVQTHTLRQFTLPLSLALPLCMYMWCKPLCLLMKPLTLPSPSPSLSPLYRASRAVSVHTTHSMSCLCGTVSQPALH